MNATEFRERITELVEEAVEDGAIEGFFGNFWLGELDDRGYPDESYEQDTGASVIRGNLDPKGVAYAVSNLIRHLGNKMWAVGADVYDLLDEMSLKQTRPAPKFALDPEEVEYYDEQGYNPDEDIDSDEISISELLSGLIGELPE